MIEVSLTHGDVAVPVIASGIIPAGFVHGFTTRAGGVSGVPFETFNLGMKWGDARENVVENRRRLGRVSGAAKFYFASQVHGASVVCVREADDPANVAKVEADALCSRAPGVALAVFVADCIPLLIADVRTGAFAAAHAGWRGTVAGVAAATLAAMGQELGTRPDDVRVALGPCIGPCCFEVGPEVVDAVERAVPGARAAGAILDRSPRAHVDLRRVNSLMLQEAGVPAKAIDAGGECTSCDAARFYSYRRDRGQTGQHMGFIARR